MDKGRITDLVVDEKKKMRGYHLNFRIKVSENFVNENFC